MPNPPSPIPLSSSVKVGVPRQANDPLSIEDQLVWLLMDRHARSFVEPVYGADFPSGGWINPASGATDFSDYHVIDTKEYEGNPQYIDVCYRKLPGALLSGQHTDETSGIVTDYTKQMVKSGTVTGGVVGNVVTSLVIGAAGSGGTAGTYNLGFSGGGGTGAAGTYTITGPSPAGKIGSLTVTNGGAGYTQPPTASITGGGGSGAVATVLLLGSQISAINVITGGNSFTDVPVVSITDLGTGNGANATAVLTATTVGGIPMDVVGSGYTTASVTIGPPDDVGGTQATASANLTLDAVTSITITNAGTGYRTRPSVTITGDGTGASGHSELTGTSVESVTLNTTGSNYQNPMVSFVGGGGSGAVAAILVNPAPVQSLVLTAAGSGYSSPTVTISGGSGSGATATATLATGTITSVTLTNPGSGYTSAPTVTTPSGGITGALVSAIIGSVTYVDVEPLTKGQDLVMRSSIDQSSIPPARDFPGTYRVRFADVSRASLILSELENTLDVGLMEWVYGGGSGPVFVRIYERYLTTSQYQAYVSSFALSHTGRIISRTLWLIGASNDNARVWTFRTTPWSEGTSAGVLDLTAEKQRFGIYKLTEIVLPSDV